MTDVLETVLRIANVSQYASGLGVARNAVNGLSEAEIVASGATGILEASMAALLTALKPLLATLTPVLIATKSLGQFGEDEQVWIRLARALHNVGSSIPLKELQDYASARQDATGIDDEATGALATQLIQLRFTTAQWKALIPALQEAEAAQLGNAGEIARSIRRFVVTGQARGLVALGLDVNKIKNEADQVGEIIRQLTAKAGGSIDDFHKSYKGAFDDLLKVTENLFSTIGDALAPVIIPIVRWLRDQVKTDIEFIDALLRDFGIKRQSRMDEERIAKTAQQKGFGPNDSDNLGKIATNTAATADAIARQAFGGPGTIGKAALNFRAARAAIRGGAG